MLFWFSHFCKNVVMVYQYFLSGKITWNVVGVYQSFSSDICSKSCEGVSWTFPKKVVELRYLAAITNMLYMLRWKSLPQSLCCSNRAGNHFESAYQTSDPKESSILTESSCSRVNLASFIFLSSIRLIHSLGLRFIKLLRSCLALWFRDMRTSVWLASICFHLRCLDLSLSGWWLSSSCTPRGSNNWYEVLSVTFISAFPPHPTPPPKGHSCRSWERQGQGHKRYQLGRPHCA